MSAKKSYKEFKKLSTYPEHEEGCSQSKSSVPISECVCDCYEKSIFYSGYKFAKGIKQESEVNKDKSVRVCQYFRCTEPATIRIVRANVNCCEDHYRENLLKLGCAFTTEKIGE